MMHMCGKCSKCCGWMFFILGVLFLLQDFGIWNFWNINWWSALFVLMGLAAWGKSKCSDCQAMHGGKKRK